MNAFATWTYQGTRYLAIPNGHGFHVIDEAGNNYGAWMTPDRFRSEQGKRSDMAQPIGRASLIVRPVDPR
jgi:hypothetical protein